MERNKAPVWRSALYGAAVSMAAYLLGLMLWTQFTLSDLVGVEQLPVGARLMMALAAACGALLCRVRGGGELLSALGFWMLVVLSGATASGDVDLYAALWSAAAAFGGALAVHLPARRGKRRRRKPARGKHKHRTL